MLTIDAIRERRDDEIHVIGATSAEGAAVSLLLLRLGCTNIVVHDARPRQELLKSFRTVHGAWGRIGHEQLWAELAPLVEHGRFGDEYLHGLGGAQIVFLGQGWYLDPDNRTRIEAALPSGATVSSMSELYFSSPPGPVVAITGTNGKSTTVALADHLLTTAGVAHRTAGNERSTRQFLPEIPAIPRGTLSLLEVSNRQLRQLNDVAPDVAAITSLTPDHLEEHGGWDGYVATKGKLFAAQRPGQVAIVNADDEVCLALVEASQAIVVRCGIGEHAEPAVCWVGDELMVRGLVAEPDAVIAHGASLRMPGDHNRRNAAIAVAVALSCGASAETISRGLRTFEGKSLRLETIAQVAGVEVVSDIKSTTPEATVAALDAYAGRGIVLIAGGDDKGLDYAPLAAAIVRSGAHVLLVPGSASDSLERELAQAGGQADERPLPLERCETIAACLRRGMSLASPGDVMIVSPAAAGFWTSQLQGRPSLRTLVRELEATHQEVSTP